MNAIGESSHPSVGVKLLDRDHGYLEEILREIQFRAAAGFASGQAGVMLRKLAAHMRQHFALEEGMMLATRFPGTALHRLQHQLLLDEIDALATHRGRTALERNAQLLSLLAASHHTHIGSADLDYGLWLHATRPQHSDVASAALIDL